MLRGEAYNWWVKEDTYNPVQDWGDLKARMYREFVKKHQTCSRIPPKPTRITKLQTHGGKSLNSQQRVEANLPSLGADYTVSRSKLFQEGGYDAVIKPEPCPAQDSTGRVLSHSDARRSDKHYLVIHNRNTHEDQSRSSNHLLNLEAHSETRLETEEQAPARTDQDMASSPTMPSIAEKIPEHCSDPMEFKINRASPETTWNNILAQFQDTSKLNQPKKSSDEEDIAFSIRVNQTRPELDTHAVYGACRPDQDEPARDLTCSRKIIQQRIMSSWNQAQIHFGLEDIHFLSQRFLDMPHLGAHGFMKLQTYTWHPGDFVLLPEGYYKCLRCTNTPRIRRIQSHLHLTQPDPIMESIEDMKTDRFNQLQTRIWRPGGLSIHPRESTEAFPCTSNHRIRRILLLVHLPYLDAFTPMAITHQRLVLSCCFLLDHFYNDQNVPEKLTYPLKPSRYKEDPTFLILADLLIIVQRLVFHSIPRFVSCIGRV